MRKQFFPQRIWNLERKNRDIPTQEILKKTEQLTAKYKQRGTISTVSDSHPCLGQAQGCCLQALDKDFGVNAG